MFFCRILFVLLLMFFSVDVQADARPTEDVLFSQDELNWIKKHNVIKVAVEKNLPPYEYFDANILKGITSDYIKLVEQKTGIKFEFEKINNLSEGFEYLKKGKADLMPMANKAGDDISGIVFTPPYVFSSFGIFGRNNTSFINRLDDISKEKIAVSEYTFQRMPVLQNRGYNFIVYDSAIDAIKAVGDGNAFFYIGDILHTKFYVEFLEREDLHYIAPVDGSAYSFRMAVYHENEMLRDIITKIMRQISAEEHAEIRKKWTSNYFGKSVADVQKYLRYLYILTAFFIVVLISIYFRIRVQKKKMQQLAHIQKMESVGRLAGGVAHDFNNMLAGIRGAAEALSMKSGDIPSVKKYTDIIVDACERSAYLTSQLLVFSGDRDKDKMEINMHECLKNAVSLFMHGVDGKIIVNENLEAKKCYISGNNNLLQSMILNLVFNAKDAMNGEGQINIFTRNVMLNSEDIANCFINVSVGEYIQVGVRDFGCGIPQSIRHKIFEPFFTTKDVEKGTGLGLAAVYGIVAEHGGTISLDSSDNGTIFNIYFPVINAKDKKNQEHKSVPSLNIKVLVVDDEKILLELTKDILTHLGAEVVVADNAETAIDLYKNISGIDIVMLDMVMPNKSGLELYEELLKINPQLKVIFMSGYHENKKISELEKQGKPVAFVCKPCSVEQCVKKIMIMLAKK